MRITRNRFVQRFTSRVIVDTHVGSMGYYPRTEAFSLTTTNNDTGESYEIQLTGPEAARFVEYRKRMLKEYTE